MMRPRIPAADRSGLPFAMGMRGFRPLLRWVPAVMIPLFISSCRPAPEAAPEAPTVTAGVYPESAWVGVPVTVEIRVMHPAGDRVRFPAPIEEKDSGWTWSRSSRRTRAASIPGWSVTQHTREGSLFDVGEHRIFDAHAEVILSAPDGTETRLAMPDVRVIIESVLDLEEESPESDPLDWPDNSWPAWLWAIPLMALISALAGWGVRRWMQYKRGRRPPPPVPAHETALGALRRLLRGGTIEADSAEPFYRELSTIVRRYIEDRFGLHAPEQTTEEFMWAAVESGRLNAEQRERVKAFLMECDLVKFARHEPDAPARRTAWAAAERLVRETAA